MVIEMILNKLKRFLKILTVIIERFFEDRLTYAASALTFTTLLALVPLITVSTTIISAFPAFNALQSQVKGFIFSNFLPSSSKIIQHYLQDFVNQAGRLSGVGTILLIVTAILMLLTIERSLNDIWHVKQRRKGVSAWLRYWAILSLAPILITSSIAFATYVTSRPLVIVAANSVGIGPMLLAKVMPFFLMLLLLWLLYVLVPNCKVKLYYGFIGALITAVLFKIAKRLFVFYLVNFSNSHMIYGAMETMLIFLIWVYISWVIILFGALVTNVFEEHTKF